MTEILKCKLYDGEPYIAEKDGKYHVLQGIFTADIVDKWYDTEDEAIKQWNRRAKMFDRHEKPKLVLMRSCERTVGRNTSYHDHAK